MSVDHASLMARMRQSAGLSDSPSPVKQKAAFAPAPPPPAAAPPGGGMGMDPNMMAAMMAGGMGGAPPMPGAAPMPGAGSMMPPDPMAMMGLDPATAAAMGGGAPGGAPMPAEPLSPESMQDPAAAAGGMMPPGGDPAAAGGDPIPPEIRAAIREELEAMWAEKEADGDAGTVVSLQKLVRELQARLADVEDLVGGSDAGADPAAEMPGAVAGLPPEGPGGEDLGGGVTEADLPPGFADILGGGAELGGDELAMPNGEGLPKVATASRFWGDNEESPYVS